MAELQKRLEQYRLRKRRKETLERIKERIKDFLMLGIGHGKEAELGCRPHVVEVDDESTSDMKACVDNCDDSVSSDAEDLASSSEDEQADQGSSIDAGVSTPEKVHDRLFRYTLWTVYFLFWCTLYVIAIELKFGIVFLMFSALFGIYFNTRTGPRHKNEISAYSVFNKNCESIDGTLKAEQFEREIRYGSGSVR